MKGRTISRHPIMNKHNMKQDLIHKEKNIKRIQFSKLNRHTCTYTYLNMKINKFFLMNELKFVLHLFIYTIYIILEQHISLSLQHKFIYLIF